MPALAPVLAVPVPVLEEEGRLALLIRSNLIKPRLPREFVPRNDTENKPNKIGYGIF